MGTSSAPQVRHGTLRSTGEAFGRRRPEKMPESLRFDGLVVVIDLAKLTSVCASPVVALRLREGRLEVSSTTIVRLR
jgi:hypothetical protein